MRFPYSVKYNGKYCRPNQEIPDEIAKNVENPVETVETLVKNSVETVETEKKPTKRAKKD